MKSENKNFLINLIYQVFTFIIPLVTMPYISRILGADNIGINSFTYSIVNYFMLATMLGINNYGVREISKATVKGKDEVNKTFSEIYAMQFILGSVLTLAYYLGIILFASDYKNIFFIQGIFLISTVIDINWLFFGLEKFKTTVTRNIIIKILSLVLIFAFVKNGNDLPIYALILSISALISQLYLWLKTRGIIKLKKVKFRDIIKHLKPSFVLFIPVIAYSIYRVMDKTMLGSIVSTTSLGYYENAEKIINVPIALITALGTVMLPHMSKITDDDQAKKKISETFKLILTFIVPIVIGMLFVSNDFSIVFFGESFEKCGDIIKLLSITVLFTAIANVIRMNYLIPKGKDKIYVTSTILGAVVNLVLNLILIPILDYFGACIGTIAAEFVVMAYQLFSVKSDLGVKPVIIELSKQILRSSIIIVILFIIQLFIQTPIARLITSLVFTAILFFITNYNYLIHDFLGRKNG